MWITTTSTVIGAPSSSRKPHRVRTLGPLCFISHHESPTLVGLLF
jgi:hypothetical protein